MNVFSKSARNAALVAAAAFGRFGATKDNSPEAFEDGLQVTGYRGKVRTRTSRPALNKRITDAEHYVARYKSDPMYLSPSDRFETYAYSAARTRQVVGSMRGTEWLQANRMRRAAGLPQLRTS